jgi:hypothetical protein
VANGRRGGARAGAPGRAYGNRTDLNQQRSLPARTAPGQTYGAARAQLQAQRLVPMAPPPAPLPPGGVPGALGPGGGGATMGPSAPPPAAPGWPEPGSLGSLTRPSERPDEPVTSGAAMGPGPGPESLPFGAGLTGGAMAALLQRAAHASGSPGLATLAAMAANQGK